MTKEVYLVCGVPGAGKTWVATQLKDKFSYLPHDEHYKDFINAIAETARKSDKPVITECPFAERITKEQLEKLGLKVHPVFVVEDPEVIKQRFRDREKKEASKASVTRAVSILERAREWRAPFGTSKQILDYLKHV